MSFEAVQRELFFKKGDALDPRLGETVKTYDTHASPKARDAVVAGYPDEEGIQKSGGRLGACIGPQEIRRLFYRMTPPLERDLDFQIWDAGDLEISGSLEERHAKARQTARTALAKDVCWIGLGGGHDYGFPDGAAFLDVFAQGTNASRKPIVINFDAHLDVRPLDRGITSGTPFFRLLNEFPGQFDFVEIGIQSQCNSKAHRGWVEERGGLVIMLEDLLASNEKPATEIVRRLGEGLLSHRPAYLSVDIDVFSSSVAPGSSQSFPLGLEPRDFFQIFQLLVRRLDVRMLGIYEVSPPLDTGMNTVRLAGQILHKFLSFR